MADGTFENWLTNQPPARMITVMKDEKEKKDQASQPEPEPAKRPKMGSREDYARIERECEARAKAEGWEKDCIIGLF